MPELGLIIPGLRELAGQAPGRAPRLAAWLARGRQLPAVEPGRLPVLAACAGVEAAALAAGPLAALGDGILDRADVERTQAALLQPVSLSIHGDHVTVAGLPQPPLALADAEVLAGALAELWQEDGFGVRVATAERWYLQGDGVAGLARGIGRVEDCLGERLDLALQPAGAPARLRRLLTEAQMLCHAHPLNARREAAGEQRVDGLWLSGGGRLGGGVQTPALLLGDEPLARGLMRLAGREPGPRVADFAAVMRARDEAPADAPVWLWLSPPGTPEAVLETLEQEWIRPAWRALAAGRLSALSWRDETGFGGRLGRRDRWRLWARRAP